MSINTSDKRLRLRRNLLGLNQDEFTRRLGLTAQLIRKFEAGDTRVSASRLYDVATQLAAPITWFFEDLPEKRRVATTLDQAVGDAPHWRELLNMLKSRQLLEIHFSIPR